jgi:carboxymethylenebutenolidase
MGAWAPAAGKVRGGVLVIHENRGLNDHIRSVAGRWAASGWSALALDLLSRDGGTDAFPLPDGTDVPTRLGQIAAEDPTRFDKDMRSALTELDKRVRGPLGATGFCFGGGMVWRLLATRDKRLSAAAPFYGPFPEGNVSLKGNKAAVLGIYAGLDTRVNDTRERARLALEAARLDYELLTFTGEGVNHAFFNDTGARFNPMAAEEAWRRVVGWFNDAEDRDH